MARKRDLANPLSITPDLRHDYPKTKEERDEARKERKAIRWREKWVTWEKPGSPGTYTMGRKRSYKKMLKAQEKADNEKDKLSTGKKVRSRRKIRAKF